LTIFQLPAISTRPILTGLESGTLSEPSEPRPEPPAGASPSAGATESRRERLSRQGHRTFLYIWALAIVAALVILIAMIVANTRQVKVSWVFGDGRISLIWVVVACGLAGWLGGIATAILFHFRTRRRG
jgi:uncharacterized integral membrane protein